MFLDENRLKNKFFNPKNLSMIFHPWLESGLMNNAMFFLFKKIKWMMNHL